MNGSAQFDDAHKRRVGEIGGNGEAFDALGRHLAADGRWGGDDRRAGGVHWGQRLLSLRCMIFAVFGSPHHRQQLGPRHRMGGLRSLRRRRLFRQDGAAPCKGDLPPEQRWRERESERERNRCDGNPPSLAPWDIG